MRLTEPEETPNRGPKRNVKRGKYAKIDIAARIRILNAYDLGGDWKTVAANNGINLETARSIVKRGTPTVKKRGGFRHRKLLAEHEDFLLKKLAENASATLKSLQEALQYVFHLTVSITTIDKHLDSKLITVKKVSHYPETLNSMRNKELREIYVKKVMDFQGRDKTILYQDETNLNLYCRRTYGRSVKGCKAMVPLPSSQGANIHVLGLMSQSGNLLIIYLLKKIHHLIIIKKIYLNLLFRFGVLVPPSGVSEKRNIRRMACESPSRSQGQATC